MWCQDPESLHAYPEITEYRAKLEVSKLLGHGRADVTKIYLASAEEDEP